MGRKEAEKLAGEMFMQPTNTWTFGFRIYLTHVSNRIGICGDVIYESMVDWIEAGSPEDSEGVYNLCDKFTQSLK
jgi:hypothetical protein